MRGNKLHVDRTKKDTQRGVALAKGGGKGRMFGPQAAGPARPGHTGKNQSAAPGAKSARRGTTKMAAFTPARSAKPGRTGAR
jgi:hypothetical protein